MLNVPADVSSLRFSNESKCGWNWIILRKLCLNMFWWWWMVTLLFIKVCSTYNHYKLQLITVKAIRPKMLKSNFQSLTVFEPKYALSFNFEMKISGTQKENLNIRHFNLSNESIQIYYSDWFIHFPVWKYSLCNLKQWEWIARDPKKTVLSYKEKNSEQRFLCNE